jgi:hypothetical protein
MIKLFYKYALIALVIATSACQQSTLEPKPFFDRKKMGDILTDIHLAEANVNTFGLSGDSLDKTMLAYYETVYRTNQVTEKDFNANYTYYLEEPALLDSVYADVLSNLAKLQLAK